MKLFIVALTLLAGCGTRRQQADFAWFAAEVAVDVIRASATQELTYMPEPESPPTAPTAAATIKPVVAPNPDEMRGPTPADLERANRVALEMTHTAQYDARTENCDAVVKNSKYVRRIDRGVYDDVFMKDDAIRTCMGVSDF